VREHIVIRRPEFVAGTRERPEVGVFTQTHSTRHPVPWGKIAIGEPVWMKWTGGPVVATARVSGIRQLERASPRQVRDTTSGFSLHRLEPYWASLAPAIHAVTVYLEDEHWLGEPISVSGRSRGESWIVFGDSSKREAWFSTLRIAEAAPRRARRGPRTISLSLRFQVFRRDAFTCQYCGRKAPHAVLHVDHVQPWSSGGSNDILNLRTACDTCNLGKGATAA
jgi:hypothetical protein